MLDEPNARSSHCRPTPRGGGIVFVAVSLVSSAIVFLRGQGFAVVVLPLLVAPLAVVGLFDDRHNLPSSLRYGIQLLTALLIFCFTPLIKEFLSAA